MPSDLPHLRLSTYSYMQALRIAVNNELGCLEKVLPDAIRALTPGGRLAVISFHSLEDRVVKWAFLKAAGRSTPAEEGLMQALELPGAAADVEKAQKVAMIVTRRPVIAGEAEAAENPRSRSAKLRVLQKL